MKVTSIIVSALMALALWSPSAGARPPQKPEELAQQSAESWLALVDSGKYLESWEEAAEAFKNAVTKDQWQPALKIRARPLRQIAIQKAQERNLHQDASRGASW